MIGDGNLLKGDLNKILAQAADKGKLKELIDSLAKIRDGLKTPSQLNPPANTFTGAVLSTNTSPSAVLPQDVSTPTGPPSDPSVGSTADANPTQHAPSSGY